MSKRKGASSAERSSKWRNTIKEDKEKLTEFRKKEAKRKLVYRQQIKEKALADKSFAKHMTALKTERQKIYRSKKKEMVYQFQQEVEPYSSRQTFGKAVRKM